MSTISFDYDSGRKSVSKKRLSTFDLDVCSCLDAPSGRDFPLNSAHDTMLLTPPMPCATLPTARGKEPAVRIGRVPALLVEADRRGPLAQLAEQVTLNHPVPGSIPGRLTNTLPGLKVACENCGDGEVSELVDEHDLGSCAARRRSSSLLFPTTHPLRAWQWPTDGQTVVAESDIFNRREGE